MPKFIQDVENTETFIQKYFVNHPKAWVAVLAFIVGQIIAFTLHV